MKTIKTITSLALAGGLVLVGGASLSTKAEAATEITLNHYMFVKHFFVQKVVKAWGDKATKLTDGRVKLIIPKDRLTPTPKQWSSVTQGVAGMAISHDGFQRKRLELMKVAYLPLSTVSAEKSARALWRTYEKFFKSANEYKGVKLIGVWGHGGAYLFNSKRPVNSIAEIKGLKLRVTAGTGVDAFKLLGVSTVTSAGPQVFELVSKKVVDGVLFPADGIPRFKIAKFLPYVTEVPGHFYNQSWSLIMNQKKWDGLSKADQTALDGISGEPVGVTAGKIFDVGAKRALTKMVADGMKKTTASAAFVADLRKTFAPLEQNYIDAAAKKGVDGKAALAFFRAELAK